MTTARTHLHPTIAPARIPFVHRHPTWREAWDYAIAKATEVGR